MYRTIEPRPNGLPPIERTWYGISVYNPLKRSGPSAHVVAIRSEGEVEMWLIESLDLLPDLMRMLADIQTHVDGYSVLKPLPAFQEAI